MQVLFFIFSKFFPSPARESSPGISRGCSLPVTQERAQAYGTCLSSRSRSCCRSRSRNYSRNHSCCRSHSRSHTRSYSHSRCSNHSRSRR